MNRRDLLRQLLVNTTSLASAVLCSHCYSSSRRLGHPLPATVGSTTPPPLPPERRRQASTSGFHPVDSTGQADPGAWDPALAADGGREEEGMSELASLPELNNLHHKSMHGGKSKPHEHPLSAFERHKMMYFDQTHPGDLFIARDKKAIALSITRKLERIQKYIGFGHFNLVSFDEALKYARQIPGMGGFTRQELEYFDEIFYFDAEQYGFYGKKLVDQLTKAIPSREVIKIPFSGHYLYRDVSLPIYQRIIKDVGASIILTSGVRSIVKQMHLFFSKALASGGGNLSQASRSLAPPGYSYHGVGDFDVGKKGLGGLNFTSKFSETDEYKKLIDLGYIDIRYPFDNPFGVRFEPWHILGGERRV